MKVLGILIALFISSELILLSQIESFLNSKQEIILQNHKSTVQNEFKVIVNILRDLSQNSFRGFINKPNILEALQQKDRKKLYELLKKDYRYLENMGFKQVHFHLPNNDSFLRMHQPHRFGDNLTQDRYSVAYVNKYKKFIEGIEAGKVVPGYRFVYPLFLNNEHIGSVELSFSINKIVNEIEKVYKTHTHYLIKKDIFDTKVFNEFQKFYIPSIEHPEYIKLNRSYFNKIEPWYHDGKYKKIVEKGLLRENIFSFELDIMHSNDLLHTHKVVTFLPLMNIEKTAQSYFVFYSDNTSLKHLEREKFYVKTISSVLLFFIFAAAYIFYLYKESILRSRDTLQKFNQTLEKTVAEKTKELNKLNKDLEIKIQQEIEKSREKDLQIFLQSKKAAMGEMTGAIAHQWRQPLNELSIRIQKLQYDFKNNIVNQSYLDNFINSNKQNINFMSKTIDGFRNFFRVDKEKKEFQVKQTIQDVTVLLNAQLSHHNILLTISGDDFTYKGFKTEFQQVILNIFNNAKDAIIDNHIENGEIVVTLQPNHITITDNAGGVPKELEYKIFDLYFTTKDEYKGSGMGLYISKVIIEDNMQGKLYLENSDSGATFHIEL